MYFNLEKGCWECAVQDKHCLVRSGSIPSILPVHRVAVRVLPSDPSAAVAVLIPAHTALGELLPGLGGREEVTGSVWQRPGVTWNFSWVAFDLVLA